MAERAKLTRQQEVEAQALAARIAQAAGAAFLQIARLLVSREPRALFGATEFQVRDLLVRVGAKAYEEFLREKKTAMTAPASPARAASRPPSSRASAPASP
jgi:parvulin-like peptidyl-prolyl isomerase